MTFSPSLASPSLPHDTWTARLAAMPRGMLAAATLLAASLFGAEAHSAAPARDAAASSAPSEGTALRPTGNTILITGGGSGIGRELAQRFHALGNTVIITGRRLEPLRETIGDRDRMVALTLDLDDPQAIDAFARRVVAEHPALNVLINNAGIMRYEDVGSQHDLRDAQAQITTNLLGPIRMNNALIEHLKTRPGAALVNVSSGLAFVPRADAAIYSATKAAVHSYTQSLRQQLKGQVRVIELIPPGVQTELTPGQSVREGFLPLNAFMEEVMALFQQQPVPDEIVVQRAHFQRYAERENRHAEAFARINAAVPR
ncbi:SDR family oxidoreductase [Bordetella genomosp. 5]|uniref:SDR family oxidoreductase n=1 Tax=Bordetella genomosp. 5 TaxID=1395608 RepID=UPI0020CD3753|nr:SDR family oxidoreductase [Bordetella genomosp. 5]